MSLDCIFEPRSVAVIGASAGPGKLGHTLLQNVIEYGFKGPIYPVNPRGGEILGLPVARSISELAGAVDLALISIPNDQVVPVLEECARAGVRAAVVLSSGFGEAGEDGRQLQARLRAVLRDGQMRVVGPNCMGVYNPAHGFNGSYFWSLPRQAGGVSFVSQSGAMGGLFFAEAAQEGFGVAKFASIGNTVDVDQADLLEYLGADPQTRVIGLFIEGLRDGQRFLRAATRVTRLKPVVALKAGRTGAGTRAAASHTGSLAGVHRLYRAALEEAGVILTSTTEEFLDVLRALATHGDRLPAGPNVAVITVSGGPSVLAADACEEHGLSVPPLSAQTQARLRAVLPPFAATGNPVDLTPQVRPDAIGDALDAVGADPGVDAAVFINLGVDHPQFREAVPRLQAVHGKPVVALVNAAPDLARALGDAGIPLYRTPERAVAALAALARQRQVLDRPIAPVLRGAVTPSRILDRVRGRVLDEYDSKRVLAEYGMPVTPEERVETEAEALDAAERIGYPVALKLCSTEVLHKSDVGGVRTGLAAPEDLRRAWQDLARIHGGPFLVQAMVAPGPEFIVGARYDDVFGHFILVGLGGVLTELVDDVALALGPLSHEAARGLIERTRAARLLKGYRGLPAAGLDALARCVVAVSDMVRANPQIAEVDVNPVIVSPEGPVAVDALIVLRGE